MRIALVGYGKMGKAIERIAVQRGHEIVLKISTANLGDLNFDNLKSADVAIEFTNPESAFENVATCLTAGMPVVCGSTGWNDKLECVQTICATQHAALLQASNFSIGANVFFEINAILAKMMNAYPEYEVGIEETHHTHKKDAPSGTAITLAERLLENINGKNIWVNAQPNHANELSILSHRIDQVPGTHVVKYSSPIDDIELIHTAHNRDGFALGAVVAAEFLKGKKGIYTMKDVLGL
ncbi:MAG: 4-hydroxy-tetrahydrodipicolinate reductase [Phycisphaerales bacterium]|nr:4-hydroxy-tetrahydrodipicolinate reductase [Phycisphaerales bacterium]